MRNLFTVRQPLFLTLCAALGAACSESPGGPATTDTTSTIDMTATTDTTSTMGNTTSTMDTTSTMNNTTSTMGNTTSTMDTTSTMGNTTSTMGNTTSTMGNTTSGMDTTSDMDSTSTMDMTSTDMTEDTTSTTDTGEMSSGDETTGSGELEPMTFEDVRAFLDTEINGSVPCFDCHHSGGDLPYVFKNDDTLYDTLMTTMISRCEDRTLVVPGDPDNSALYLVLQGTCGTVGKMPSGCYESADGVYNLCSSHEDRERLRLWIEAGAPE